MDNRDFLKREVEILRQIPPKEVMEFIEKNGERMRELVTGKDWVSNLEILEMLLLGYR